MFSCRRLHENFEVSDKEKESMTTTKVVFLDSIYADMDTERGILAPLGAALAVAHCRTADDIVAVAHDADVIMLDNIALPADVLEQCPRAGMVLRAGIGVDNIDLAAAGRRGIPVCNVPDYCLAEVADHAVALLLAVSRRLVQADRRMRTGDLDYLGMGFVYTLRGKTVGFMGFGRIARIAARTLSAFDTRQVFFDPFIAEKSVDGAQKTDLEPLLAQSDFVSLHMPGTPQTRHIIDHRALALMKSSACLINTSRGGAVDTEALADALEAGTIAGAGLDVVENELDICPGHRLCRMDNVILTPHMGWYSEEARLKLQRDSALEVARFLRGEPLKHVVNADYIR